MSAEEKVVVVAFNRAHLRPLGQSSVLMCTLFQPLAAVCPVTGFMGQRGGVEEVSRGLWELGGVGGFGRRALMFAGIPHGLPLRTFPFPQGPL